MPVFVRFVASFISILVCTTAVVSISYLGICTCLFIKWLCLLLIIAHLLRRLSMVDESRTERADKVFFTLSVFFIQHNRYPCRFFHPVEIRTSSVVRHRDTRYIILRCSQQSRQCNALGTAYIFYEIDIKSRANAKSGIPDPFEPKSGTY